MPDWNPNQYLKFATERTQASVDLASRIEIENPQSIIDVGCGPGNSTQVLRRRWNNADIFGIDSSADMIAKASHDYQNVEWIVGDASIFEFERRYDIVFSNAAVQWMPNHEAIIPRLFGNVSQGGALAVQMPQDKELPIHQALLEVSKSSKWSGFTSGAEKLVVYHDANYYYDLLSKLSGKFNLWETIYYHVLNSQAEIVEWYKGSLMRYFLERIPSEAGRKDFEDEVLAKCVEAYPNRRDGKVLFPFKRIFFVVYK